MNPNLQLGGIRSLLAIGGSVEVSMEEEGLFGSLYGARVIQVKRAASETRVLVEYDAFNAEEEGPPGTEVSLLREWVRGAQLRALPPPPPSYFPSQLRAGDSVEVRIEDGWWPVRFAQSRPAAAGMREYQASARAARARLVAHTRLLRRAAPSAAITAPFAAINCSRAAPLPRCVTRVHPTLPAGDFRCVSNGKLGSRSTTNPYRNPYRNVQREAQPGANHPLTASFKPRSSHVHRTSFQASIRAISMRPQGTARESTARVCRNLREQSGQRCSEARRQEARGFGASCALARAARPRDRSACLAEAAQERARCQVPHELMGM